MEARGEFVLQIGSCMAFQMTFYFKQVIEFTVEDRHLWILETRTAKRTPQAAVRAAVDMVQEKLITEREALLRLEPDQMDFFLHPTIDTKQGMPY